MRCGREIRREGRVGCEASRGGDDEEEAETVVQCEVAVEGEAAVVEKSVVGKPVIEGEALARLAMNADDADGSVRGFRGANLLAVDRSRLRGGAFPSCCGVFCFVHADAGCCKKEMKAHSSFF